jgi:hypothetical protein
MRMTRTGPSTLVGDQDSLALIVDSVVVALLWELETILSSTTRDKDAPST